MSHPRTCGEGLAEFAPIPELLGRLAAAVADVLEAHVPMLDLTDRASANEHAVYVDLVEEYRRASRALREIANRMAGSRDLPMGRHVDAPEANEMMARSFAELVACETELAALLEARLPGDRHMLDQMSETKSHSRRQDAP